MPELPQNGPLSGQTVLITRAAEQCKELAQKLGLLGAAVHVHPVIRILLPEDSGRFDATMRELHRFSVLIFLSSNAARSFLDQSQKLKIPLVDCPPIAAIGKGTESVLAAENLGVAFKPEQSSSESMGAATVEFYRQSSLSGPVLILRADRGSDVFATCLTDAEVPFEELAVYRSEDVTVPEKETLELLEAGSVSWITLTSSAIARNVARLFGDHIESTGIKLVSISPTTSAAAFKSGLKIDVEAETYNMDGVVNAIRRHVVENA